MAIELCSETSSTSSSMAAAMSPRISFSHDFSQTDDVPIEQYIRSNSSSSSTIDFDFCVFRESLVHESSSADELFFDGKILPIEIKKKLGSPPKKKPYPSSPAPPPYSTLPDEFYHSNAIKISKIQTPREKTTEHSESDVKQNSKPVPESEEKQNSASKSWFKRSSSLNCGSNYARSLCPLPSLSRSNSTGSTTNVKKQQNLHKSALSSSSSSGHHYQKPPLKKSYSSSYGNNGGGGVKINPVLNVPTPSFFGLGSIFSNSKDKNKKK